MTVKTATSFTDRHHAFARKKVEEGSFASVSSVVAAGIEQLMRDEQERQTALEAMQDTIKKRMQLPRDQWVALDGDDGFARARKHLASSSTKT